MVCEKSPCAFQRGRQPERLLRAAGGGGVEFLRIEEKELVVAARLADRGRRSRTRCPAPSRSSSGRCSVRSRGYSHSSRNCGAHCRREPRNWLVPLLVTASDLQTAAETIFSLISGLEHLDLGDRLGVHVEQRRTAAPGVHRGHAVHHDVARHALLGALGLSPRRAADAGRERRQEVNPRFWQRQALDGLGRNAERALAARRLNQRALGLDVDRLRRAADLQDQDAPGAARDPGFTWTLVCFSVLKDGITISRVYLSTGVTGN